MKHNNERLAALSRRLDPLWWLLARLLRLKPESAAPRQPRSILLVELHLLGDIVMLVPLLRVIRRAFPQAHIGLMAGPWAVDILSDSGLVDEIISLRAPWVIKTQGLRGFANLWPAYRASRKHAWDWGIDVRGDVRNALLLALAGAKRRVAYDFSGGTDLLTDVVPDDGVLRHIIDHHADLAQYLGIPMTPEERIPALAVGNHAPSVVFLSRRVAFHFGASMALRRMPLEEACALLRSYEHSENTQLLLVDAPDVAAFNTEVLGRLPAGFAATITRWQGPLRDLLRFFSTLDKFYAMDSGPAHLAAAVGVDTTVFFGPHLSRAVRPFGKAVTVVERSDLACRPCDQHVCTNSQYQKCLTGVVPLIPSQVTRAIRA